MNILVSGGLGFIGSHTCLELLNHHHEIIIVDNLSNSKLTVVDKIVLLSGKKIAFYQNDVTKIKSMESIFQTYHIDAVIHFAGLKAVKESLDLPLEYYYNNLLSTMVLCQMCLNYGVNRFVFSSSATVYGNGKVPFNETMPLLPRLNPYGESKAINERILMDIAAANPEFAVSILRYFNPVGAHESGLLGEDPNGKPNNLMPYIAKVAKGEYEKLMIFGNDYPTIDGTGVRDYIHVVDLAKGHVAAVEHLEKGVHIYNLGTGQGTSVLELVHTFMTENRINIPYEFTTRRSGDIAVCYADVSKAKKELDWRVEKSIKEMVRDAWRYEQRNILNKGVTL